MAAPWEKYSAEKPPPDGPWAKYVTPQETPSATVAPSDVRAPAMLTPGGMAPFTAEGGRGFVQGIGDVIQGGAQTLVNALPESVVSAANRKLGDFAPTAQQLNQQTAEREQQIQAAATPISQAYRMAGNVAATAPISVGFGITGGALTGGLGGAFVPVTDTSKPFWQQRRSDMLMGAGLGGGLAALGTAAGSGLRALGILPKEYAAGISPQVQTLMEAGVTPTPGQIKGGMTNRIEEKLTSVPVLGDAIVSARQSAQQDLNRAVMNRVLEPLGETFEGNVGREGVAAVYDQISKRYDKVLPKLNLTVDQQLFTDLQALEAAAQKLPADMGNDFRNFLTDFVQQVTPNGQMSGETFKKLESEIGLKAKNFLKAGSGFERDLGGIYRDLQSSMREALARTTPNAADAAELRSINDAFRRYTALERASTAATGEGVMTPFQLSQGVKMQDPSGRRGRFARGEAEMQDLTDAGVAVLGSRVPDSGTAGRAFLAPSLVALGGGLATNPALTGSVLAAGGGAASMYALPATRRLMALSMTQPGMVPYGAASLAQLAQERR